MIGGNALGDGSEDKMGAKNETRKESFSEKYRRELSKDVDDLGMDENEELGEDGEPIMKDYESENEVEPEPEVVETFDDDEEFVSSKDMFEDM